jgi:hypothetical protein
VSGSSEESMGESLQFLSQNMVDAISGSKDMALWFDRVGIKVQQLRKMNAVQVFEAIADKFEKVGDAGQNSEKKIALTRALMGRGGAEMIQMLNQGSAALKPLYAESDKYFKLNAEQAAEFKESADNIKAFERSLLGLFASITRIALPGLNAMLKKVADMNVASRAELGDKIGRFLGAVIEKMPKVLTSLGQISKALVMLLGVLDSVAQALGGWDTLMVVFASVTAAKGVAAVYALAEAIGILSGALVVTPVGWFLIAVAAISAIAYTIYKNWEPIKQWFTELWDGILEKINLVKNALSGGLPGWIAGAMSHFFQVSGGPSQPSAMPQGTAQKNQVGGTLKIQIDSDGRPSVTELRKAPGSAVDFDVYNGPVMGAM